MYLFVKYLHFGFRWMISSVARVKKAGIAQLPRSGAATVQNHCVTTAASTIV